MSPLQKIAMGLVIVFVPAYFDIGGQPYDLLADPLGWVLVVAGMRALRGHLDVDVPYWFACAALLLSIPLWLPQVTDLLPTVDAPIKGIDPSVQWFVSLPQAGFSLLLARAIGHAGADQKPRDVFVAGRYGVLTWAFLATIVVPPIAFGGGADNLIRPTLIGIGLVNVVFIYYLFRVHRRTWLGGPGPLLIGPKSADGKGRPPSQ